MNSYVNIIIWSLAAGICLCNFYIYYNKVILGGFVRALLEREAFSPDTALALSDMKLFGRKLIELALKKGSHSLYGVVSKAQDGAYYIPGEKITKARKMFSSKGVSFIMTVLLSLLVIAAAYLLTLTVPVIISLADSIF